MKLNVKMTILAIYFVIPGITLLLEPGPGRLFFSIGSDMSLFRIIVVSLYFPVVFVLAFVKNPISLAVVLVVMSLFFMLWRDGAIDKYKRQ